MVGITKKYDFRINALFCFFIKKSVSEYTLIYNNILY